MKYYFSYLNGQQQNQIIMNKQVKSILLIVGVVLLIYGIYTLIMPEASLDLGIVKVEEQDNTNAYITIVLGIIALAVSLVGGKK
ncbi:hypothetical protein SAMN05660866_02485 [Maribacter arcticus]|uniref:Uncharacterized protein n=2 Tax=Maribacter arcticus TaxID=561365 RepID=A0A1T5CUB4_9FLAO|nr:hypothetical protein SAMN05660866_02485 [Maribacter arcticus]